MWNLDDASQCRLVVKVALPWAWTFADMRRGKTDREKRERIRAAVAPQGRERLFERRLA
jgi:hypothetical protein